MDSAILQLLNKYNPASEIDFENALKEIVQQIALLGLWRSKFFEHAAFYGDTALRIFYGLRRFSEDLDFSMMEKSDAFDLDDYIHAVEKELTAFGFDVDVKSIEKNRESPVESAFIKGNCRENLIYIEAPDEVVSRTPINKKIKIKFEVDTDPPKGAEFEVRNLLTPIPFSVRLYTKHSLFAGKLHALLCRKWIARVKGRDYYDFIWFISQDIPCHLSHLKERMIKSGHIGVDKDLHAEDIRIMLVKQFRNIDFIQAKNDILPFVKDPRELDLWGSEFFISLVERLIFC